MSAGRSFLASSGTFSVFRLTRSTFARSLNLAINCFSNTSGVKFLSPLSGSLINDWFAPMVTRPASSRIASSRPVSTTSELARTFGGRRRSCPRKTVTKAITIALALFIATSIGSFQRQLDADSSTKVPFITPLLDIAGDVPLALRLSMAGETSLAVKQRQHYSDSLPAIDGRADDPLAYARIGGLGKLFQGRRFKLISLVLRIPEQLVKGGLLQIEPGPGGEDRRRMGAEGGRDEILEPHPLFVDDRLVRGDGLLACLDEHRQKLLALEILQIDTRPFLEFCQELLPEDLRREALVALIGIVDEGLDRSDRHAA